MSDIEDIYGLSPLQEGMLFQNLLNPGKGEYLEQIGFGFQGTVNVQLFERAWQRVVDRNAVLRTSFHWEGLEKPAQVVHAKARIPLHLQDLRYAPQFFQTEHIKGFLRADREKGFDLRQAPLIRLALFRLAEHAFQLFITFHHIILDGWSFSIVLNEAAMFQNAFHRGQNPNLPAAPLYSNYIAWLQKQDLGAAEIYWRKRLAGYKGSTALVLEEPPAEEEGQSEITVKLPKDTTARIQAFAKEHKLTLNTLVQGVWAVMLGRYTNETDVAFGTVVSGRPPELEGVENMVGLFINTLPARVGLPPGMKVLPWLQQLQAQQFEARQFEFTPMVQVQTWSEVPRGVPLFESVLVFNNFPGQAHGGGQGSVMAIEHLTHPINVLFAPGDELSARFLYSRARFREATIQRMADHWKMLLESIVATPEQRLSDLSLLTDVERRLVLFEWNQTPVIWNGPDNLVALFEQQVERSPDAEAVKDSRIALTYTELNRCANRIGRRLQRQGVGLESVVGVRLQRSVEAVAAILGILKAGAAYLPLDPAYPQNRLTWMIEDSRAQLVLDDPASLDAIEEDSDNLPIQLSSQNAAYVIYTSGSTGQPKGVVGLHGATVNRLRWMWREFPYSEDSVSCHKTALSFVDSVWEIFGGLLAGVRTVILSDEEVRDADQLLERVRSEGVTRMVVVPSLLRVLLELKGGLNEQTPQLREWFVSGEALDAGLWKRFQERTMGARLINLYGSSEVAGDATWYDLSPSEGVAIGRPMSNVRTYVLDEEMRAAPIGVTGELYVAGAGLARGYLGRPDLTAERFVPDPFSEGGGARMYRTGDLARWRGDGNLEYVGRRDHQVKIRGHRIELGEVEAGLMRHNAVCEAIVMARADRLVAFVVAADPASGTDHAAGLESELLRFLSRSVPDYMVPSSILLVDAMPLTPNGKVDRRALAALSMPVSDSADALPPASPTEETLASIWCEVLNVKNISVRDNFFELGGHSLLATQLISRIRDAFGVPLPIRAVFEAPTVAGLAELIEQAKTQELEPSELPIERAPREKYMVSAS